MLEVVSAVFQDGSGSALQVLSLLQQMLERFTAQTAADQQAWDQCAPAERRTREDGLSLAPAGSRELSSFWYFTCTVFSML